MSVNYPNGPHKILSSKTRARPIMKVAPGNRGMDFEADINQSNEYYLEKDLCLISKRPTPIRVVKVDYTHGPKITQAYFEMQSTTDYNGVYEGRYLDFEAKSTISKTSFPLNNIPPQQIKHLQGVLRHGGIAFFLINCVTLGETYLLPAAYIIDFYQKKPRKSIPIADIKSNGYLVKEGYRPRYDYLPLVKELFLK